MASKNTFEIHGDSISIFRPEWKKVAHTTYREDYYDELCHYTWYDKKGYPCNGKLGHLHRYIMLKWYGQEVMDEMKRNGWVVDHMDNNHYNARISNLEFLATRYNVAKGQVLDVETKKLRSKIALSLFKDFSTKFYQITIAFNDETYCYNKASQSLEQINALYLLYDCDYRIVIRDAEQILLNYDLYRKIELSNLQIKDYKLEFTPNLQFTEQEKKEILSGERVIVERNGVYYLVKGGNSNTTMLSKHYIEGWKPSQEDDKIKE